jgi:hypothetical protein
MLPNRAPGVSRALSLSLTMVTLIAGCGQDGISPSPDSQTPESSASAIPTPTPSPTPTPEPTPTATPNQGGVPLFAPGVEAATTASGIRVRDLPGTQWGVAANLPSGAKLLIILGPLRTSGFGWYLVADADPAAPTFREGWVAAGYAPNPFLAVSNEEPPPSPGAVTYVAGWAALANGEFGPVHVEGVTYALRWAAALPPAAVPGATCLFQAGLALKDGQAVTFAKTTVARTPAPGVVQSSFFISHPSLQGDLYLQVRSDCSWAVTVVRLPTV